MQCFRSIVPRYAASIGSFTLVFFLAIFSALPALAESGPGLSLGANVNESLDWLVPNLLDQSHTTWVRGFVPAFQFMHGERSFKTDPGLMTLNAAARSGRHVILSIKWDCSRRGDEGRVPAPGSAAEKQWFGFADDLLDATRGNVSAFVVVNELLIDTQKPDLEPGPDGQAPMIRFMQRLVAHLAAEHPEAAGGGPLPIFAGGLTRMDKEDQRTLPATRQMIAWVNHDPQVAGLDYHLHQPDMSSTVDSMRYMHAQIPNKPLIVTEFSLVWKWQAHMGDRVGESAAGAAFLKQFNLPENLSVAEFCNDAFGQPVPDAEWQAFLASQPWFEPDYLDRIAPLMQANGIVVATYAFTLDPFPRPGAPARRVTAGTPPWFVNNLFIPSLAVAADPHSAPVNYGFFASYVRYQLQHGAGGK